jgi:hypothetical protein
MSSVPPNDDREARSQLVELVERLSPEAREAFCDVFDWLVEYGLREVAAAAEAGRDAEAER